MSSANKREIPGISGPELEISLARLRRLRKTLISEQVLPELEPTPSNAVLGGEVDKLINLLESRTHDSHVRP